MFSQGGEQSQAAQATARGGLNLDRLVPELVAFERTRRDRATMLYFRDQPFDRHLHTCGVRSRDQKQSLKGDMRLHAAISQKGPKS
jgi:hypothetical protein